MSSLLHNAEEGQYQFEVVSLEELVREDHLLRKIKKHINFSFILEKTKDQYCPDNGRPAIDPTVLFKMLLIGFLFGIRSERRLVQGIQDNVAYRWFLGLGFHDPVPSASTIWQNRRRRWKDGTIFQEVFDEIVRQAIHHRLVDGSVLFSDSTFIKANANKKKYLLQQVPESTKAYFEDLEKAVDADREAHGKKPETGEGGEREVSGGQDEYNRSRRWLHGARGQASVLSLQ